MTNKNCIQRILRFVTFFMAKKTVDKSGGKWQIGKMKDFRLKVTNRVSVNIQTFKPSKFPNKWSVATDQKKIVNFKNERRTEKIIETLCKMYQISYKMGLSSNGREAVAFTYLICHFFHGQKMLTYRRMHFILTSLLNYKYMNHIIWYSRLKFCNFGC